VKIKSLRLKNFMSYAGVHDLDFSDVNTCVIVGENGTGKSSILEAVLYALFGQSRAGSEDQLSNGYDILTGEWAVDSFSVGLVFEMGGKTYSIARERNQRKATLVFINETDKKNYTANGIRETQDVIHKIVGMEYDSFVSSVMLQQDDYDEFMKMTPAEAKEVLLEILGLDSFESKRQLAADRAKRADDLASRLKDEINRVKAEQDALKDIPARIQSNESQLSELKVQLKEAVEQLDVAQQDNIKMRAACDGVHEALKRLEQLNSEQPRASALKVEAENSFDRLLTKMGITVKELANYDAETIKKELDSIAGRVESEKVVLRTLEARQNESYGNLTYLRKRAEEVDGRRKASAGASLCLLGKPECHAELVKRIDDELLKVIEEGKVARKAHEDAEAARARQAELMESLSKRGYELSDIMMALASFLNVQSRKAALDNIDKEIARLTAQVRDNAVTLDDVRAKELEVSGLKMRRERLQSHVDTLLQELGKLNESMSRSTKLRQAQTDAMASLELATKEAAVFQILAKAFSKEGIPALMIENIIPVLEADANAMLERLSNGRIRLQFVLQRKLKAGGTAESFEIYVTDESGTRAIQMYSGGEKYRIIFAVHSAFSKYLTYRGGSRIGFLAIDEPAGLDEPGINRLVETLSILKEHYEQIFVITHLKELMEYFPQTIVVERVGRSSKATTKNKINLLEGVL